LKQLSIAASFHDVGLWWKAGRQAGAKVKVQCRQIN